MSTPKKLTGSFAYGDTTFAIESSEYEHTIFMRGDRAEVNHGCLVILGGRREFEGDTPSKEMVVFALAPGLWNAFYPVGGAKRPLAQRQI